MWQLYQMTSYSTNANIRIYGLQTRKTWWIALESHGAVLLNLCRC